MTAEHWVPSQLLRDSAYPDHESSHFAPPLTADQVEALPERIPRIVLEVSTDHPGNWEFTDPDSSMRRFRSMDWPVPAVANAGGGDGRNIVLLPPGWGET